MTAENPLTGFENYSQQLVAEMFQTKQAIQNSINDALTDEKRMFSFADHHLRTNGDRITLIAMYGNEFRITLTDAQEIIGFEPIPYRDNLFELTSTPHLKNPEEKSKTQRYVIQKGEISTNIVSDETSSHIAKPMDESEFENAKRILVKIQEALGKVLANPI